MTKEELARAIADRTDINRYDAQKVIEAFMGTIKDSLLEGENIYLRGFGTFQVKHRAEKMARNISKNSTVIIPAHKIPFFKPSKSFVEEVKNAFKEELV